MAAQAGMGERSFLRRFKAATGTTPGAWLVAERLRRARELLEGSSGTIDDVAATCGFGSVATLRYHLREQLGTSPGAYRQRFAHRGVASSNAEGLV